MRGCELSSAGRGWEREEEKRYLESNSQVVRLAPVWVGVDLAGPHAVVLACCCDAELEKG